MANQKFSQFSAFNRFFKSDQTEFFFETRTNLQTFSKMHCFWYGSYGLRRIIHGRLYISHSKIHSVYYRLKKKISTMSV